MKKCIEIRKKTLAHAYQDGLFANNTSIEKKLHLNKQTIEYILTKLNEEKYNCYFSYSNKLCHRYILTINSKIIIVTIIKINRDWQKIINKK